MNRVSADLPDSVSELCLIRLGFIPRSLSAWRFAFRLGGRIARSVRQAKQDNAGLLSSETFRLSWNHIGILQYWTSFDALEAWSHHEPHSEWWREAIERSRTKGDFVIYHESFLVPRANFESVYLNIGRGEKIAALAFSTGREPVGSSATSRERLNRRGTSAASPRPGATTGEKA